MVDSVPQSRRTPVSPEISPGYPSAIISADAGTSLSSSRRESARASAITAMVSTSSSGTVRNQST